jgi:hypothetical protein
MIDRVQVERALKRIIGRRMKHEDPHRELLPAPEDADPREVLDYLRKYNGPNIPHRVLQQDVCDALILNNWLWWEDRRRELYWLQVGRRRGLFLTHLGGPLGILSRQGVIDRIDRLEALLRYDRPNEKLARADRQAARASDAEASAQEQWIIRHQEELLTLISDLVEEAERYGLDDTEREWIDELAIDARGDALGPTTMKMLGSALDDLRTAASVVALESSRPHRVHAVLARADRLRSDFADYSHRCPENCSSITVARPGFQHDG